MVVTKNAGHAVNLEKPKEACKNIIEFFKGPAAEAANRSLRPISDKLQGTENFASISKTNFLLALCMDRINLGAGLVFIERGAPFYGGGVDGSGGRR